MRSQDAGHTLQSTAVVNEAYLKLVGDAERKWSGRDHFFGVAAKAMRQVLVDHARGRLAAKRGGQVQFVELDEKLVIGPARDRGLVALDEALTNLAALDPRKSAVVELRYFAGLSVEEIAAVMNVSPRTVARDWEFAKAFLKQEVGRGL